MFLFQDKTLSTRNRTIQEVPENLSGNGDLTVFIMINFGKLYISLIITFWGISNTHISFIEVNYSTEY